jgi:zinc transport system substrate-binding protein
MRVKNYSIILIAVIFVSWWAQACVQQKKVDDKQITVSILPQKYIVKALLGDSVKVNTMIAEGNSPATYSPTHEQIKEVSISPLYLKVGYLGFEQAWCDRFKELNGDLRVVDLSAGIKMIREEDAVHGDHVHEGGVDPHTWTSPKTMKKIAQNTKEALIQHYPEFKDLIESNYLVLTDSLSKIDSLFESSLKKLENKSFLIFHPAYTYLARDYELEQISIEHKGKEPSVQWLQKVIREAKNKNIRAIFIQKEFDKRSAEIISQELNIPIVTVNPLAEDWYGEMLQLLAKLENAIQ